MPRDYIYDMETSDPDDFLTLLLLLGHPEVNLKAVTVSPGSEDQVGLVTKAINWFRKDIPVGAFNINNDKKCVSEWHYLTYGKIKPSREAFTAPELLLDVANKNTTLLTGGSLKNIATTIRLSQEKSRQFKVSKLVVRGGFSGSNLSKEGNTLTTPDDKITGSSPTLEADRRSSWTIIRSSLSYTKKFIPENVNQKIVFNRELVDYIDPFKRHNLAIALIWKAVDRYLLKHPAGKRAGNIFAACCAINDNIGAWQEVELIREHGGWGGTPKKGTGAWMLTSSKKEEFLKTLVAY